MAIEVWEAALGAVATAGAGVAGGFQSRRSRAERDAAAAKSFAEAEAERSKSARDLAEAYKILVDDQRKQFDASLEDARGHIHRMADEMSKLRAQHADDTKTLRDELARVRDSRDEEMKALRGELVATRNELAAVRLELAAEREQKGALLSRVASLEAQLAAAA